MRHGGHHEAVKYATQRSLSVVASEKALKSSTTTTLSPAAAAKYRLLLLALVLLPLMMLVLLRGRMVDEEEAWRNAGRAMRCSNMVVVERSGRGRLPVCVLCRGLGWGEEVKRDVKTRPALACPAFTQRPPAPPARTLKCPGSELNRSQRPCITNRKHMRLAAPRKHSSSEEGEEASRHSHSRLCRTRHTHTHRTNGESTHHPAGPAHARPGLPHVL